MANQPLDLVKTRRRKQRWRVFRVSLLIAVPLIVVYIVYFSSLLLVERVTVKGNSFADTDAVVAAAGISLNDPLARINADEVTANLLELPEIVSVEVRRVWPHDIILAVVERTPVAMTETVNGWQYVDEQGIVFGAAADLDARYTAISGSSPEVLAEIAAVLFRLPPELIDQLVTASGQTRDSIVLFLKNGDEILWGSSDSTEVKAQVFALLREQTTANWFDVSSPKLPVVKTR